MKRKRKLSISEFLLHLRFSSKPTHELLPQNGFLAHNQTHFQTKFITQINSPNNPFYSHSISSIQLGKNLSSTMSINSHVHLLKPPLTIHYFTTSLTGKLIQFMSETATQNTTKSSVIFATTTLSPLFRISHPSATTHAYPPSPSQFAPPSTGVGASPQPATAPNLLLLSRPYYISLVFPSLTSCVNEPHPSSPEFRADAQHHPAAGAPPRRQLFLPPLFSCLSRGIHIPL